MCERSMDGLPPARPQLGTWPSTQACALTGNQNNDLSVCRPALTPLSHTTRAKFIFSYMFKDFVVLSFISKLQKCHTLNMFDMI